VKQESTSKQVHSSVDQGWMQAGSFLNSVLAGTLLGYVLDLWLGTEPWLVIIGIVLGSYSGFMKIWAMIRSQDEEQQ
jgi:ATP synthase protein I